MMLGKNSFFALAAQLKTVLPSPGLCSAQAQALLRLATSSSLDRTWAGEIIKNRNMNLDIIAASI